MSDFAIQLTLVANGGRDAYLFEGNEFPEEQKREAMLRKCKAMAERLGLGWMQESIYRYLFAHPSKLRHPERLNDATLGKLLGFPCPYDPRTTKDRTTVTVRVSSASIVWVCVGWNAKLQRHLDRTVARLRAAVERAQKKWRVRASVRHDPGSESMYRALKECDFPFLQKHEFLIRNDLFFNYFVEGGRMEKLFRRAIHQRDCKPMGLLAYLFKVCVLEGRRMAASQENQTLLHQWDKQLGKWAKLPTDEAILKAEQAWQDLVNTSEDQ